MIEPTTQSGTTSKGRALNITTWAHGNYSLVRRATTDGDYYELWSIEASGRKMPRVEETSDWGSKVVTYGVNWSALGTMDVSDARAYAAWITEAADAAVAFTAIRAIEAV